MAPLKVRQEELPILIGKLSELIDFDKDLPLNVFVGGGFVYWFLKGRFCPFLIFFKALC